MCGGTAVDEPGQRVGVDDGAGRVVRVADEDQPGAVGDRGEHRVQVEGVVGQRHLTGVAPAVRTCSG